MDKRYIISVDQSTQGTKALLFDSIGKLIGRVDLAHKQIINESGWISHNPDEIYQNTIKAIRDVLRTSGVSPLVVAGIGISNQRETSLIWDKFTGEILSNAIVWQCARATKICERPEIIAAADKIKQKTGLTLSPYFPAAKIAWFLENVEGAKEKSVSNSICHGTMDTYLVYRLTKGKVYATDYSNASRTQLFNIFNLKWDEEVCETFGVESKNMPLVLDSNACFGYTDCEGIFEVPIPIHAVIGDSHAALFGQNCRTRGKVKATYGTGSSIMMNVGDAPVNSVNGLVTSLAWGIDGKVQYVLEGNLNYTGAVISWLKNDMELIKSEDETDDLANQATKQDSLYLVPAFSGLGAPYWDNYAKASIVGMTRTTKKAELVRAALECAAYQITDVIKEMEKDSGQTITALRVDGGATKNKYLMQFQSDIAGCNVEVSKEEELSGIGAAIIAGVAISIWNEDVFKLYRRDIYHYNMNKEVSIEKYKGWKQAVRGTISMKQHV